VSSRKFFLFWKVVGWLHQSCKSDRAFRIRLHSRWSLSKCFGPILGLHTKLFCQKGTILSPVTVEAIEFIKSWWSVVNYLVTFSTMLRYRCPAVSHILTHSVNFAFFFFRSSDLLKPLLGRTSVHVVFGSQLRPCKPSALDLTIANTWVRSSSWVRGDTHNSQIT